MIVLMAVVIGGLYAAGLYMMMRRSIVKLIFGLFLLGHAANLLIFTIGGLEHNRPPLIAPGEQFLSGQYADPLPQALILTAIVIGFGVQAFAIVLIKRAYQATETDDLDRMKTTDDLQSGVG
ncbi:MAG: Na+/H+ antiporter subunit C [Chloroflexota bacterium]